MATLPIRMPTVVPLDEMVTVPVNRDLLARAAELTHIEDPAELVAFAVKLVAQASPSTDILQELRGEFPGLEPEV